MAKKSRRKNKSGTKTGTENSAEAPLWLQLFSKAAQSFFDGVYAESVKFFTVAILENLPNRRIASMIFGCRAQALLRMNNSAAAEKDCTTALLLDPSNSFALLRRAVCHALGNRQSDAEADLSACDEIAESPFRCYAEAKSTIRNLVQNPSRTPLDFDAVSYKLTLFPEELAVELDTTKLSSCSVLEDKQIPYLECTFYDSADDLASIDAKADDFVLFGMHKEAGIKYLEEDEYENAVSSFTTAIGIFRRDAHVFYGRGYAYLKMNKLSDAIQDFSKAIIRKADVMYLLQRANAWFSFGNLEMAQEDACRIVHSNPDNLELLEDLQDLISRIVVGYCRKMLQHPGNPTHPQRFIAAQTFADHYLPKIDAMIQALPDE